jgi:hypothetical protein
MILTYLRVVDIRTLGWLIMLPQSKRSEIGAAGFGKRIMVGHVIVVFVTTTSPH